MEHLVQSVYTCVYFFRYRVQTLNFNLKIIHYNIWIGNQLVYLLISVFLSKFSGNYSVTGFEMILKRRMSHYMITYYLPSSLFVVVSWTSFLIPSDDIQGRMALLVTLFLVLVSGIHTCKSLESPTFFLLTWC